MSDSISTRILSVLNRRPGTVLVALLVLATLRIAATWCVFNHTSDEPAHIACGTEWLSRGQYRYEPQHPPLTRVMVSLGPYLLGARTTGEREMSMEGLNVLNHGNHYDLTLALSRAGNLPFFWLATLMSFLWGRRLYGTAAGVLSAAVFTLLPLVLAHAGLSTTDMGLTATFAAALYTLLNCWERPGWRSGLLLGLSLAGMLLCKFSSCVFFPAALAAIAAVGWRRARPDAADVLNRVKAVAPALGLALATCLVVLWAGYRFSFGTAAWFPFRVPFPELFDGLAAVREHNRTGHWAYLLGDRRGSGWLVFFEVLFVYKTPIAALALVGLKPWLPSAERRGERWPGWLPWVILSALFVVVIPARITIGLRHLLPAFVWFAVLAGGALWELLEAAPRHFWAMPAGTVLALWLVVAGAAAHPDYLPYFNAFAGDAPERIAVDSDLDWGQDMKRLAVRLKELDASAVAFSPHIYADLTVLGFPSHQPNHADKPEPGWNAVSLTELKLHRLHGRRRRSKRPLWPEQNEPVERVGHSILLYYFPARPQL
jgi:4-amino-4-deoxy-L-arabinose transferase-like glycosyltransferase